MGDGESRFSLVRKEASGGSVRGGYRRVLRGVSARVLGELGLWGNPKVGRGASRELSFAVCLLLLVLSPPSAQRTPALLRSPARHHAAQIGPLPDCRGLCARHR
jgi:hypothetical protein